MNKWVLLSLLVSACSSAEYSVEDCANYLEVRSIQMSVKACTQFAKSGDVAAMRALGRVHLDGIDTENQNLDDAVFWLNEAAKNGDIGAYVVLGWQYFDKDTPLFSYERSVYWYEKGLKNGCNLCANMLGILYSQDWGYPDQNLEKALSYYRKVENPSEESIAAMKDIERKLYNKSSNSDGVNATGS